MTKPECSHAEKCGGCTYQGVPYEEQLQVKEALVRSYLSDVGLDPDVLSGIAPAPDVYAYRNKMEYSFGDETKGGEMTLGLYRKKSYMSVIETDGCMIVHDDFDIIRKRTLLYMREAGLSQRNKKTRDGYLRNLVIRRSGRTGEILVNLVTTDGANVAGARAAAQSDIDKAIDGFVDMLLGLKLSEGASIVGITHTIFSGRADTIGCDELRTLYGRTHYYETLLGYRFEVGVFTFFQTNVDAVERMFENAFTLLPELTGKSVYDIYCGTGAISLAMSARAGRVTGIEIVDDSVITARRNAELNNVNNAIFIQGDAFEIMDELYMSGERPDIAVVDPPRMGLHPKALARLASYELPELLYISCNPKTFARDAALLSSYGYSVSALRAFDNFPLTRHVETVSRLMRAG